MFSRGRNNPLRLFAYIMLAALVIVSILSVVSFMGDSGMLADIWSNVLSVIPFPDFAANLAVSFYVELIDSSCNISQYLVGGGNGFIWFMENFCKLCLTAMLYGSLANFLVLVTGIKSGKGIWVVLQRLVADIISAVAAAFLAGIVLGFLFEQVENMVSLVQGIISGVSVLLILAGSIFVFKLVLGCGLGMAFLYVLVKMILVNVVKLEATYLLLLILIICMAEKAYLMLGFGVGVWGVVIVVLIGIEMLIESVFN